MKTVQYISILLLFWGSNAAAQNLHFSQYFNSPLLVNPANTGFNPDYNYRIGGNYRNQWASLISNPYQTTSLWGDAQLFTNKFANSWMGIGATVYKDEAGSGNLTSTQGYVSIAYHQMLDESNMISLGFGGGAVNKRIDKSKLTFDDQWNGKFFDTNSPPDGGETFTNTNATYFDLQVGVNYSWYISETAYLNVGISALHINRPKETFFLQNTNADLRVLPRYTGFVNANFKIEDIWILNPNLYYSTSAGANEIVLGMNANRDLSGDGTKQLIIGLYYRYKDAFIPLAGYQINDLKMTVSYDVTASSLSNYNGLQGAYEASIIKTGLFKTSKGIKCATVRF
jgi:type IX secretion system PorP/SprF family membrane protein